jgi:SAM-dependent methyltransferase
MGDAGVDTRLLTAGYYDEIGVKEWLRLEADARQRVILHVHTSILRRFVREGDHVLDAGCGAGRFSVELTRLGAQVAAGDLSAEQTALAAQALWSRAAQNHRGRVAQFSIDHLPFGGETFDRVVCFGSVLSHLGEGAEQAAGELIRVTKQGGLVLLSVQPAHNYYLPYIVEQVRTLGLEAVDEAMMGGTELHDVKSIPWRQFSRAELESLAESAGCEPVLISASNVLATIHDISLMEEMERDEALWSAFLRWEEHLGQQPGNTERGAFIISVFRKLR